MASLRRLNANLFKLAVNLIEIEKALAKVRINLIHRIRLRRVFCQIPNKQVQFLFLEKNEKEISQYSMN